MSNHFINKCSCGAVISQCRCMDCKKTEKIIKDGCHNCKARLAAAKAINCTCGAGGFAPSHEIGCPAGSPEPGFITYIGDGEETEFNLPNQQELGESPIKKRPGMKHIETLPEGESCVGMVVFNDRVIVATTTGVFFINKEGSLEPIQFIPTAFDHMDERDEQ